LLHYKTFEKEDDREWVVFIHGAGGSSSIWYKQVKDFRENFNVLLVDLRGHGRSKTSLKTLKRYSFEAITKDVIEVLDDLKIKRAHFVGISLGTIVIRELAEMQSDRVISLVMGGAIMKLNFRSKLLLKLGVWLKSVLPYMLLYRFFAFIIMPKGNHKESRSLFIREAKKLYQKEFIRWFKLAAGLNAKLKFFWNNEIRIPTLYIMGAQDHMFLPSIQKLSQSHQYSTLQVVEDCGHVVNVEQPLIFNQRVLHFLNAPYQALREKSTH
jgi:pimeloyl-ACP methyl ester carboxylesterase